MYPYYVNIIIISYTSKSQGLIILLHTSTHLTDVELERIMKSLVEEQLIVKLLRCFDCINEHDNGYRNNGATSPTNPRPLRFLN
jgi:hypothetical protein